jgi:hypothetical protein
MTARLLTRLAAAGLALLLAACNPTYNWRDYASPDASWHGMFPAKPASFTRSVDLDGMHVAMTMTAAEVEGATFAIGTGVAPDAARARAALEAMRIALLRNIGASGATATATASSNTGASIAIDASSTRNGTPVRLVGRVEARGTRFYQVIVVGPSAAMPAEQVEQFLTSFTPR